MHFVVLFFFCQPLKMQDPNTVAKKGTFIKHLLYPAMFYTHMDKIVALKKEEPTVVTKIT